MTPVRTMRALEWMSATEPLTGVLPIDKPAGPTSHDMVALARRSLRIRRIGHTGTLDPFATGLLLLCVGAATRLAEYLTGLPKTYEATLRLGATTRTDDVTGEIVASSDRWQDLDTASIRDALAAHTGPLQQVPPAVSAKKVAGERAYRLAREGAGITLAPVAVHVHDIRPLRVEPPEVSFEVSCSAGTYVRALARDVGDMLGVGAHLTALRRTAIGPHGIGRAIVAERMSDPAAVADVLLSPLDALAHRPRVRVGEHDRRTLAQGGSIASPPGSPEGLVVVSCHDELVAMGEVARDRIHPRKVFVHA